MISDIRISLKNSTKQRDILRDQVGLEGARSASLHQAGNDIFV